MKRLLPLCFLLVIFTSCINKSNHTFFKENDEEKVTELLRLLDNDTLDITQRMRLYSKDIVHMAQGEAPITNLNDLKAMFLESQKWGYSKMTHKAEDIHSFEDHIIVRGSVEGTWFSKDGSQQIPFKTNNLMTLKRTENGKLKVWHVIFNRIE